MKGAPTVDEKASADRRVVSTRYPRDRIKLLEAVQARRRDEHLSDTVAAALDQLIHQYLPGAIDDAA